VYISDLSYSEYNEHATFIFYSVAWLDLPYFTTFSEKQNVIEHRIYLSNFSTDLSEIFLILRRKEQYMIEMYIGLHLKCPLFSSDFNEN
jgi:hypothetical protein